MPKILEKPKKISWIWLLPVALLLLAAAVFAPVIGQLQTVEQVLPQRKTVMVNDGVNIVAIEPPEGVPVNELAAEAFSAQGDLVIYNGAARQGIDVSEHQGVIDWQQVARSGISFAYLRLGYRGATEGQLHTDLQFAENWSAARAAGMDVGVYFFSQATDEREAIEEADYVLEALNGERPDLPVMFDWEPVDRAGSRTEEAEPEVINACAAAFCRRIAASGLAAGVYFNRQQGYYTYDLLQLKDYAFWLSDPNDKPDFYYAFCLWQYSFTGSVPGIGTVVDRDLLFEGGGAG